MAAIALCSAYADDGKYTYHDIVKIQNMERTVAGLRSMNDGKTYTVLDNGAVVKYSYATGESLATLVTPEDIGKSPDRVAGYSLSPAEDKILFRLDSKPLYRRSTYSHYVVYDMVSHELTPVHESDSLRYAVFSPDGRNVAFVLRNDIYVKDIDSGETLRVTHDGEPNSIINGLPDWVYEEEWLIDDALRWSPDGNRIAFLRLDESKVREYTISYYAPTEEGDKITDPLYPRTFTYKYPVAGGHNSVASLHVYDMRDGSTSKIDTGNDEGIYLPFFDWTPDGKLYFMRINRHQNHLEVFTDNCAGDRKLIYDERSDKYISDISMKTISFLSDGHRFIVKNETRTGFSHLYMYDTDKGFLYPITEGEWEVRDIVCVTDKRVWFLSNETSPVRNNLYSVATTGRGKRRLTDGEGTYRIAAGKGCEYYISYFSNSATPTTITLHDGRGRLIRVLEDNAELKAHIASHGFPVREFFTFPIEHEGKELLLNAYIMKPEGFDPSRRYPILFTQYSGPSSQEVLDTWFPHWEEALVKNGYIVVCMDPRGTGGRGEWFKKLTYGRMGLLEAEDHLALARHMATLPYVDSTRMGIYGWSYGGFTSLNCVLRSGTLFRTAISVAPVTSWRYYDSVYTERVNGLPQENPEGYDLPSPIFHADGLECRLLLMHGSADDNVHPQNTYKMAYELVKAGKQFDMMIFTDDDHSMRPGGMVAIRQKMLDYCLENL